MLVGGWIVYVGNNRVQAADAVTGKTVVLGNALAFAPSAAPGDVWLEYGSYQTSGAAVTVRSVPVSGGRPGPPVILPGGTQLVAGTDAGLLLEPRDGVVGGPFWLWTPGTAPRALPYSPAAEGFAVSSRLVAFGTDCANPSTAQSLSYGGNFGYYACRTGTQATAVPSSAAFLLSVTAWSPDSSWLFYQGPGQHMWAYQVTTGQARSSTTTCCQYAVMATIKSPRS
jgi:hypothetical protein